MFTEIHIYIYTKRRVFWKKSKPIRRDLINGFETFYKNEVSGHQTVHFRPSWVVKVIETRVLDSREVYTGVHRKSTRKQLALSL